MKKIISILTFIIMGMLVVSACLPQPAQPIPNTPVVGEVVTAVESGPVREMTPEVTSNTPIEPGLDGQLTVTLEDNGKVVNLVVGESFLLQLGDEYTWQITINDENVISRVTNISVVKGGQGVYEALQLGTVTLTALGDPQCRQQQPPCGAPSILFEITIVVK